MGGDLLSRRATSTRRRNPIPGAFAMLLVVVVAVSPLAPSAAVQAGPVDDGVSCEDAKDPCTLREGTRQNELVRGANDVDYYVLQPPADGSIIHIDFDVQERLLGAVGPPQLPGAPPLPVRVGINTPAFFSITLRDPSGDVRDTDVGSEHLEVSSVGAPQGTWLLEVGFHDPSYVKVPPWRQGPDVRFPSGESQATYNLSLDLQNVDHVRPLEAPGSPAPTVQLATGQQDLRLELYYTSPTHFPGPHSWGYHVALREEVVMTTGEVDRTTAMQTQLLSRVPPSSTEVWTKGAIPEDLGSEVHLEPMVLDSGEWQSARLSLATQADTIRKSRVSVGFAWSEGIRGVQGWMAWNESAKPAFPKVDFEQGRALFADMESFEDDGNGTAARVGPASAARNTTLDFQTPEGLTHGVFIRAENWANKAVQPRFDVHLPNGTMRTLEGESEIWALKWAPSGDWTVDVEQRVGTELDQIWVAAASFPLLDKKFQVTPPD